MDPLKPWLLVSAHWALCGVSSETVSPPTPGDDESLPDALRRIVVHDWAWERACALNKFVRNVQAECAGNASVARQAPRLPAILAKNAPHVLGLVATDLGKSELANVAATWLSVGSTESKTFASLVSVLRASIQPTKLQIAMMRAHEAAAASRAVSAVDFLLKDGGTLLAANKDLPLARIGAVVAIARSKTPSPETRVSLRRLRAAGLFCCTLPDDVALRAVADALATPEAGAALFDRLPPRLVPLLVRETRREEEAQAQATLLDAEPPSSSSTRSAAAAAAATEPSRDVLMDGWDPETACSQAVYGVPDQPCVRAVLVFNNANWTREFKKRGWVFGPEERYRLMRASRRIRPLDHERVFALLRWLDAADRIAFERALQAESPAVARDELMNRVVTF